MDNYHRNFELFRTVDGDTLEGLLDLGIHVFVKQKVRLSDINAPECRSRDLDEKKCGSYVKNFVSKALKDRQLVVATEKPEGKFGRVIGKVLVYQKGYFLFDLGDMLLEHKLVFPYGVKWKDLADDEKKAFLERIER